MRSSFVFLGLDGRTSQRIGPRNLSSLIVQHRIEGEGCPVQRLLRGEQAMRHSGERKNRSPERCSHEVQPTSLLAQPERAVRGLAPAASAISFFLNEGSLADCTVALRSISIDPLKNAPSSIVIRAVVMSPVKDPPFFTSTISFARTLPLTLP